MEMNDLNNKYTQRMSETTDKELVNIVHICAADYQQEAVAVAESELYKRELSILQIDELKREINEDNYRKVCNQEMPLQTYWKVLTFIFPGVLNLVFAMIFTAEGYDKRTKEMWKWTFYGFCFYVAIVFLITMI